MPVSEGTGEGGIRTLGSLLGYGALAKRCFRPLSHLTKSRARISQAILDFQFVICIRGHRFRGLMAIYRSWQLTYYDWMDMNVQRSIDCLAFIISRRYVQ